MGSTDHLQLSELKIFKTFKENLKKELNKTVNLLTCKGGVLFAWDFENSCVLTLNLKAAKSREADSIRYQNLLPLVSGVLFTPELLLVNESLSLIIVAGPNGILVMELPIRYPPYGAFDNNKELVYCKSHSLDERLLTFNNTVQVRQVRFHPGSETDSHILALTSDNMLRLYFINKSQAVCLKTFRVGQTPYGMFPGSKSSFLSELGDVAVDFCFGNPEINKEEHNKSFESNKEVIEPKNLLWSTYILMGDGQIYYIDIPLTGLGSFTPALKGPLPNNMEMSNVNEDASSIISLKSCPQVFCIANSSGRIYHCIVLPLAEDRYSELKKISNNLNSVPKKEILCFECVELELGLSTTDNDKNYCCPIFLHRDDTKPERYFATHSAGVHSITINCCQDLFNYVLSSEDDSPLEDVFGLDSAIEYLICTKVANSEKANPIIGFTIYTDLPAIIASTNDGNIISLGLLTAPLLPELADLSLRNNNDGDDQLESPFKKMLNQPFDQILQKILTKTNNQPILKLTDDGNQSQKECYELLQRASQVFSECYFENLSRAREEIEKRVKALKMMKEYQLNELDKMNKEKVEMQNVAENLAEKYEDIKDKQDIIMKRCEKLLLLCAEKSQIPSDAENEFTEEMQTYAKKLETYKSAIDKLKQKVQYQKIQVENWKQLESKKTTSLGEKHEKTIKSNIKEMSEKIAEMVDEIKEYKRRLHLK